MTIFVDHTHVWRAVTGLERITLQLFSPQALAPLDVVAVDAHSMSGMVLTQNLGLASRLVRYGSSILLCPGFPPSPLLQIFGTRVIPYIHDVFLLTRRHDLNARAKLYMAWPFARALHHLPRFMVNSLETTTKLAGYCRDDAEIMIYRPGVPNTFGLHAADRALRPTRPSSLRLVALGTVEPRKNLIAAARIVAALRQRGFPEATLQVIGRRGWGEDWATLERMPGVILRGYLSEQQAAAVIESADALISTSHEEGLGLPLLEAQYAGLPIIAPGRSVFHEVLNGSGFFIDPADPSAAADSIAGMVATDGWRAAFVERDAKNIRRWNGLAALDRWRVIDRLAALGRRRHAAGDWQTAS